MSSKLSSESQVDLRRTKLLQRVTTGCLLCIQIIDLLLSFCFFSSPVHKLWYEGRRTGTFSGLQIWSSRNDSPRTLFFYRSSHLSGPWKWISDRPWCILSRGLLRLKGLYHGFPRYVEWFSEVLTPDSLSCYCIQIQIVSSLLLWIQGLS